MAINKIAQTEAIKNRRMKIIDRISRKRHWSFSDMNPYFVEVYEIMPKITEALSYRSYKKQLKIEKAKYEKMAMLNYIRTRLCV
jgi:uncharacterized Zn finger protein